MIPVPTASTEPWQAAVRNAVRDIGEIATLLDLPLAALGAIADSDFPLLAPRSFLSRVRKGDLADPLLLQVLPRREEGERAAGFDADPVREQGLASNGVLQKYPGRVLLIASGTCPLHCRYCFRRSFPYSEQLAARSDWGAALAALRGRTDIREVILSGGDPLSLSTRRFERLVVGLEELPIETLRIHTRFPIAIPERIDRALLGVLARTRLKVVAVIHCNHANELDSGVAAALAALRAHTAALLNQAVLLRGVNDDVDVLAALSERLFECGVLPYYLHLLDRVAGAAHFEVDERTGRELVSRLRARLPGYLVPRLVQELPGELSKTPIG